MFTKERHRRKHYSAWLTRVASSEWEDSRFRVPVSLVAVLETHLTNDSALPSSTLESQNSQPAFWRFRVQLQGFLDLRGDGGSGKVCLGQNPAFLQPVLLQVGRRRFLRKGRKEDAWRSAHHLRVSGDSEPLDSMFVGDTAVMGGGGNNAELDGMQQCN